jgi:hypothetical protein
MPYIKPLILILIFSFNSHASSLSEDAKDRGINETCYSYLNQVEKSYRLNGLNITYAHPDNPSKFSSLHISTQIYNNGASAFSSTLTPDGEYCYISTVLVTSINNQSCLEIAKIKAENENLQISSYAEGGFIILSPADSSFQTILTSSGKSNCTMIEARMMWPGR